MTKVIIDRSGEYLTLKTGAKELRFHAIWLRDNAKDSRTRSAENGQRLITLGDIPKDTGIKEASVIGNQLKVNFRPEEKTVVFDILWLQAHAYDTLDNPKGGWLAPEIEVWDANLADKVPVGDFEEISNNKNSLCEWLGFVKRFGFGKVVNGPIEEGALFRVVELFGYVRETNYGRLFEVRTEINPTNLAYTGLALQAHTDNPYRDPTPTIQVLYCLESSATGGENMVVDGFAAALRLRAQNSRYFDLLSNYCARFEYIGEANVNLTSRRPMIELAPDGELISVRFNNRSLAAITDVPFDKMNDYYAAYRMFSEIIEDKAMEVSFRLNPGESFVIDNTRVLHARKGYSGDGTRWIQGCYADKDSLRSKYETIVMNEEVNKVR